MAAAVLKGPALAAFGGNLLGYGISTAIELTPSLPSIPSFGTKSLYNTVAAVAFAVIGYKTKKPMLSALSWTASSFHVTKIVELVRTGGFPAQFVRPAPFVPVQMTTPSGFIGYPGSGAGAGQGAALF